MTTPPTDTSAAGSTAAEGTASATDRPRHYWERFSNDKMPPGDQLAALRRGIDREPGTVPALWPYYTTLTAEGRVTESLRAEHLALTLFAVHQQSKPSLVHRPKVGLGTALLRLKQSGKYSPEAVDRRFGAAATATSLGELAVHLRGLITQLRGLDHPELDYTQLMWDLRDWQDPDRAGAVRRRWGAQYFSTSANGDANSTENQASDG